MTPSNILHINTEKTWRGGERQAYLLMKLLPAEAFRNIAAGPADAPFIQKAGRLGIEVLPLEPAGEWDVFAARRLANMCKDHDVSLMHAHSSHALGIAAAAHVFTHTNLVASRRVDYHLHRNPFSRWKYRQADRIIAISDAVKSILISDGIPAGRIDVVKSGIEFPLQSQPFDSATARKGIGLSSGNRVVGIVGALTDQKDHDTFIEAAALVRKKISHITFLVVGEGERRDAIRELIRRRDLTDCVILTGFRSDVFDLIELMDVYVVSSAYEGMGTSTLDAMFLQKPVVATRVGGIPEIVEDNKTGYLVSRGDFTALSEKILYLLNNPADARVMGEAGREKSKGFSAEKTARETADVYRSVLGKGKQQQ